ncbi:MAG: BamA/TamA family outer membrane protein [Bacteroidales bacterium]|nr:BamA/TamA family outer membrane protein [Bacteroidales bacterium]
MKRIALLAILLLTVISCSTTKLLPEGTYRLAANKVEFKGRDKISSKEITQYVRQQPNSTVIFGWSPSLCVYNWSDGSGKGINKLWEKIGVPPVVFDSTLVASSRSNIAGHLEYLGYYHAKVDSDIQYKGREASVKYIVELGDRIPIDSLVFEVPGGTFEQEFRADSANITVKVGDYLCEKDLEAETVRGAAVFRDLGYYDFNKNNYFFEADTLTDRTTLYYRIKNYSRGSAPTDEPLAKYRIGRVNISHPADIPFKESLLREYNIIRPGMRYNERIVNTAYSRLSALKLFNNVSIELTPSDSATVDCDIRLSGTDLLGFKANVEASTNSSGLVGFSPQLSFYHKNLFHGGEWLNLGFSGNWQTLLGGSGAHSSEFGISSSLSFPRLLGYPLTRMRGENVPRTEIRASYNYQNRPEYRRSLASLSYGYTGQFRRDWYYQIYPLQFNLVKLYAISEDFTALLREYPYLWDTFESHVDAGLGLMLYHTTDASVVPKTAYHYERLNLDVSGNAFSLFNSLLPADTEGLHQHLLLGVPYKQYVRAELSLGKVFRFGWNDNNALALHLDAGAGWAYGNSTALPFEKQFYCGGANSMRGWQARTLGPGYEPMSDFFVLPSQTGDFKLEADAEYRFPSFWKLEWAVFAEVGNVWTLNGEGLGRLDLPGSLAADWGLGLRVNLDFILLRLDAGFKVHDPARAEGARWLTPRQWFAPGGAALHFGVGYPF